MGVRASRAIEGHNLANEKRKCQLTNLGRDCILHLSKFVVGLRSQGDCVTRLCKKNKATGSPALASRKEPEGKNLANEIRKCQLTNLGRHCILHLPKFVVGLRSQGEQSDHKFLFFFSLSSTQYHVFFMY